MDAIEKKLLEEVADLHGIPEGAYNIRADGKLAGRNTTAHINIVTKEDKPGIDIYIAPGTKNESVHIPVIISQTGLKDMVYNDFYIGDDCDVTIVAGCGIHNCGTQESRHDGIHSFFVGKNARVRYIEKHYGEGDGNGENVMNPTTIVDLGENSYMEMETTQIKGIDSTYRDTQAHLSDGATLIIKEKIMTHGHQHAETNFPLISTAMTPARTSSPAPSPRTTPARCSTPTSAATTSAPATRSATPSSWTRHRRRAPGDHGKLRRGQPHPRGRHRQDRR